MTRQLLLEAFNKRLILDLALLTLLYTGSWLTALLAGFHILKVKVMLKHSIPGALFLACISLYFKPFTSGILTFFVILLPLFLSLKFYSKSKWTISFWITTVLILSTAVFPMLFIIPLTNSNHNLEIFFFTTRYGAMVTSLAEILGIVVLLALLRVFNVATIPTPGQTVFIDIFIFGGLLFLCYYSFIQIWGNPDKFLILPCIGFLVAAAVLVAFYIKKVNEQKTDEIKKQEIQQKDQEYQKLEQKYQRLKETQLDPIELSSLLSNYANSLNSFELPSIGDLPLNVKFTNREQDILRLIAQGYSNEEIAKTLYLNPDYVSNVIVAIRSKIGLTDRDRSKLVLYAIHWVNRNKK